MRRTGFHPIIWKELRQARALLLAVAGGTLVVATLHHALHHVTLLASIGAPSQLTQWLLLPLIVSSAVLTGIGLFASELDHGTLPVLLALPVSRRRLWIIKATTGLLLAWAALAVSLALTAVLMPEVYSTLYLPVGQLGVLVTAAYAIGLYAGVLTTSVIAGSLAAGVIATILSMGAALLCRRCGLALMGDNLTLDVLLWLGIGTPALCWASVRSLERGELLDGTSRVADIVRLGLALAVTVLIAGSVTYLAVR